MPDSFPRIAVAGAGGRMGRMLIEAVQAAGDLRLAAALERSGSPLVGQPAAPACPVQVQDNIGAALRDADCLIDFTRPEATMAHLAVCAQLGVSMVIGTTGFDAQQLAGIDRAAQRVPLVLAPNMGVGVNVLFRLLEVAARALPPDTWDVEILEAHHRHKVDAPSGTALKMGEVIASAQDTGSLDERAVWARQGHTGERAPNAMGFATLRGGDLVGEHSAWFIAQGERITISHQSHSRSSYVQGSLRAARWLGGKAPGRYGMEAVLGL